MFALEGIDGVQLIWNALGEVLEANNDMHLFECWSTCFHLWYSDFTIIEIPFSIEQWLVTHIQKFLQMMDFI